MQSLSNILKSLNNLVIIIPNKLMTLIWLVLLHCKFDDSQHLFDNLAFLDAVGHFSVLLISIGLVEHFDDGSAFLREDYGRDVEGCVLCEDSAFAIESELLSEFEAAGVLSLYKCRLTMYFLRSSLGPWNS